MFTKLNERFVTGSIIKENSNCITIEFLKKNGCLIKNTTKIIGWEKIPLNSEASDLKLSNFDSNCSVVIDQYTDFEQYQTEQKYYQEETHCQLKLLKYCFACDTQMKLNNKLRRCTCNYNGNTSHFEATTSAENSSTTNNDPISLLSDNAFDPKWIDFYQISLTTLLMLIIIIKGSSNLIKPSISSMQMNTQTHTLRHSQKKHQPILLISPRDDNNNRPLMGSMQFLVYMLQFSFEKINGQINKILSMPKLVENHLSVGKDVYMETSDTTTMSSICSIQDKLRIKHRFIKRSKLLPMINIDFQKLICIFLLPLIFLSNLLPLAYAGKYFIFIFDNYFKNFILLP